MTKVKSTEGTIDGGSMDVSILSIGFSRALFLARACFQSFINLRSYTHARLMYIIDTHTRKHTRARA